MLPMAVPGLVLAWLVLRQRDGSLGFLYALRRAVINSVAHFYTVRTSLATALKRSTPSSNPSPRRSVRSAHLFTSPCRSAAVILDIAV